MKRTLLPYLLLISLFSTASAKEFQVNTRTSRNQANAAIAIDEQGNFVVVWSSYYSYGNKSNEIRGRRFGADGSPIDANEFEINTIEAGNQKEPDVTMDAAGNFVVVWQSTDANDSNHVDVFFQRFDSNGAPIGYESQVNDDPNGEHLHPKVAMNKSGAFVIVWEHQQDWPSFNDVPYVYAKIFDSNGAAAETSFSVYTLSGGHSPDVGIDAYGGFTVVWMQQDSSNAIMAKQYNADGTEKAKAFDVNETGFDTMAEPSISMNNSGHFLVTWDGADYNNFNNIYGRRYKFDGTEVTGQFQVNTTTSAEQTDPSGSMNDYLEFVIVWSIESKPGSSEREILGRRFDSSSNPIGDEFRVNTYVVDDQKYPNVVIRDNAEFIAVWQSNGQDGSEYGIFADIGPAVPCADFTGDWFVNFHDYCVLAEEWLKDLNPLRTDLVDDNKIDRFDLGAFCGQWLRPCYDCNDVDIYTDGRIDFKDYCLWAQGYLQQGPFKGDITGDGTVDLADLKALIFHWAKTCEQ